MIGMWKGLVWYRSTGIGLTFPHHFELLLKQPNPVYNLKNEGPLKNGGKLKQSLSIDTKQDPLLIR
jgi:hypothetical protein